MKLVITGCNGAVGRPVVTLALKRGHSVVGIDHRSAGASTHPNFTFVQADLRVYEKALSTLQGCDGVIHLAALLPFGNSDADIHNSNVALSWNVLRACAELKIIRIAQASSVNVLALVFSLNPHYEYFPLDELHPCLPDEPYGISKVICELQADAIVRRHPSTRIASIRLHHSCPNRADALTQSPDTLRKDLWGYVHEDSVADAFLLAVTDESGRWSGHEAFFVVAPRIVIDEDSAVLRQKYWPGVPIKENKDVSGERGFFDCEKAERLLGWVHKDGLLE